MKKLLVNGIILFLLIRVSLVQGFANNHEIDFESLFNSHQSIMLIINVQSGDIAYANNAAEEFYGYDNITSMNIGQINLLSAEEVLAERLKAFDEQRNYFVFNHRLANGTIKQVEVRSYPFIIDGEQYLYSIINDRTLIASLESRQQLLNAIIMLTLLIIALGSIGLVLYNVKNSKTIESKNKRINDIITASNVGTWEWHYKTHELIVNQRWAEIIGFELSEIEPLTIQKWSELLSVEDLVKTQEEIDNLVSKKSDFYNIAFRMRHKLGHYVWIRSYGKVVEWDSKESPILISGTHTDITSLIEYQEQIKQSEINYRAMFFDANEGKLLLKDDVIIECNHAASMMIGYKKDELIGKNIVTISMPVQANGQLSSQYSLDLINHTLLNGKTTFEWIHIHKDGRKIYILVSLNGVKYENQDVILVTWHDITSRYFAEEKIQKLSKAIEQSNVSIVITDINGVIEYVNPFTCKSSGYDVDELVGQHSRIFKSGQSTKEEYANLWDSLKLGKEWRGVFHNKHKNGNLYWESSVITPIFNSNNEITNYIAIKEDITEKKRVEDSLLISKNRLEQIAQNSRTMIWEANEEGLLTYISPVVKDVLGYDSDELMNQCFLCDFVSSHSQHEVFLDLQSKRLPFNDLERMVTSKSGKSVWLVSNGIPLFDEKGEWIGYRGSDRDITNEKNIKDKVDYLLYHDQLTGLYNRYYYLKTILELDQQKQHPIVTAIFDIDGLKLINDAFGYEAGNQALLMVSERLKILGHEGKILCRIGGDEFAIIRANAAQETLEIKTPPMSEITKDLKVHGVSINISFGLAQKLKNDDKPIENLIQEAENEMYKMKSLQNQSVRSNAIHSILKTLTNKYSEEEKHSSRVSEYCRKMALALNYSENRVTEIQYAGMLHDIGKIAIPDDIIRKPGKLTNEEWEIMKSHAIVGYEILSAADQYSDIAKYTKFHHERVDGKGYPEGLTQANIPEQSRIIAIVDSYEAMTSDRIYRKALSQEDAISELRRCSNTQFDARLVEVFVNSVLSSENQ